MKTSRFLVAALAALTIVSCKDDPVGPEELAGSYELREVNGQSLPFILIEDGADRLEIVAGRITLRENLTFTDSATLRLTSGTTVETEENVAIGTYSLDDNVITFTPSDSPQYTATITGSTLVQRDGGLIFEYRR